MAEGDHILDVRQAKARDLDWIRTVTTEAYAIYLPVLGYPPVPVDEDYGPRIDASDLAWKPLAHAPQHEHLAPRDHRSPDRRV